MEVSGRKKQREKIAQNGKTLMCIMLPVYVYNIDSSLEIYMKSHQDNSR